MTIAVERLFGPALIGNAPDTVYTVLANTKAKLTQIVVCNTSDAPRQFFLSIGSDAPGKRICSGLPIAPKETEVIDVVIPLAASEIVQSYSELPNALTLTLCGILIA